MALNQQASKQASKQTNKQTNSVFILIEKTYAVGQND
jgi:hypothetical protein